MLRERTVKPIVERRISDPRMSRADMIGHLVLNNLQTQGVRFLLTRATSPDRQNDLQTV